MSWFYYMLYAVCIGVSVTSFSFTRIQLQTSHHKKFHWNKTRNLMSSSCSQSTSTTRSNKRLKQANDDNVNYNSQELTQAYLSQLDRVCSLPSGFSVGMKEFTFTPYEVNKVLPMKLTLLHVDKPTDSFAAVFTANLFPGKLITIIIIFECMSTIYDLR